MNKEELEKVKECLIGNMKLSLESSDDIANFYGGQELLKKEIKTLEDKIKEIKKVTAEDIQKMAKIIFNNKNLNLAVIGPFMILPNVGLNEWGHTFWFMEELFVAPLHYGFVFFGWSALGVLGVLNIEIAALAKLLKKDLA